MTKLDYANEVCKCLTDYGFNPEITEDYGNNASFVSITIRIGDGKASPVFKIGDNEQKDPKEFADFILGFVPDEFDTDSLTKIMTDKEQVLNRVCYILVNSELNASRRLMVRRRINSTLEVQYKVDISDIVPNSRIAVEQAHIDKLGITEDVLFNRAYTNTQEKYPYSLKRMGDILPFDTPDFNMWVLTNEQGSFGAGAILYKGMYKILNETVGCSYICIPSSVHEWIIVPSLFVDKASVVPLIGDVNRTVVANDEVLSDRPYDLIADGVLVDD